METSLGWLPYAKTKDAIFFNELLPRFHKSTWQLWQFWPNRVSFRQAFVAERRRQWNIEKQLNELENRMSFRMNDNPMTIGSILLKNDRILKQSDKGILPKTWRAFNIDTEQGQGTRKMAPPPKQSRFWKWPPSKMAGPPLTGRVINNQPPTSTSESETSVCLCLSTAKSWKGQSASYI